MGNTQAADGGRRAKHTDNALSTKAATQFHAHFQQILKGNGSYKFILLRETPLDETCINGTDIDLLGTEQSAARLIDFVFELTRSGALNFRVIRKTPRKVELRLISRDGNHTIELELWIDLWQLDRGTRAIRFEHCAKFVLASESAICRLPADLEACVYVHHLATKNKNLSDTQVLTRLAHYQNACAELGSTAVQPVLDTLLTNNRIEDDCLLKTAQHLEQCLGTRFAGQTLSTRLSHRISKLKSWALGAPRRTRMIAIVGTDGVGKTSLMEALSSRCETVGRTYRGKHLYRKSLLYKLIVAVIRPILMSSRENFDEKISLFVYLRACLSLRLRHWASLLSGDSKITLLDRNLADFLYVDRKTDQPRFSFGSRISELFGLRIPVIHLVVDYDILTQRKLEMTQSGHEIYDNDMYKFYSGRIPSHYTVFNNSANLGDAGESLSRLIR